MNQIRGETDHCRHRLIKYCKGQGVDLGCGWSKIRVDSIGVDMSCPEADLKMDARNLDEFPDEHFDYVYSSHLLEEIENTEATLREWLRILKKGGNIVLYQADKNTYYPFGDPRCNRSHKHHFLKEELWEIFKKIGGVKLVHTENPQGGEWSFELVVQKTTGENEKIIQNEPELTQQEGISILLPTRKRPSNMEQFALSVNQTSKYPDKVEILFGIEEDDTESFAKAEELKSKCKIIISPTLINKFSDGKIHLSYLWNQLYAKAKYPIVGYFGDDVIFRTPGWDEEVRKEFFSDKTIMVCCNDVHVQRGRIATLFFTHKLVHDHFGFYLHMGFRRWYMDTYWDHIYRGANKFNYRDDIYTEHMHPDKFPEKADAVYKKMEMFKTEDGQFISSPDMQIDIAKKIEELKNLKG